MSARIEEPVMSCGVLDDNIYWVRGHISTRKMRGALLSAHLEGDEDPDEIFRGKVHRGWIITVSGDWSGCGGDYTVYFLEEEPPEVGTVWEEPPEELYGDGENPGDGVIMDKQLATWWEAGKRGR